MLNLGTVRPGSTIRIPFSTFDKDDGSSITMTNFAAADILVYKDGNTTARASTSGFTATTDFSSKTGKHVAIIDLADNTTAGFWNAGSEYLVAIDTVTVDTISVGAWVARFTIGYQAANLDTTIASLSSQTSFTLTAGPAEDDALNGHWAIIHDIASAVQRATVLILDYTGSTKTVTLAAGATFTAAAGDNISVMDLAPLQPSTLGRTLDVSSGGEAGLDWANVGSPTTTVNLSGTTVKTATDVETDTADIQSRLPAALVGGRIDANVGAISSDATAADNLEAALDGTGGVTITAAITGNITGNLSGSVGSVTGNVGGNVTGSIGSLATQAKADVNAEVDTALADVRLDELLAADSDIDGAAPPTVGSVFHELMTKTAGSFTYDQTTDSLEAIRDRGDAAWITATGFSTLDAAGVRSAVGLASANLDTQLSTIDTVVDSILVDTAEIGAAGAGLSAIPWNAAWDAQVESEVADALTAYDAATGTDVTTAAANVSVDEIQASALADLFNTDSGTTYASAIAGSVVKEIADNAGGSGLTAGAIADAVWDEALSGHLSAGSTGEALNAAGAAGDPWITALPGSYTSGQAGYIVGTNLNATVSSRATQTSVDTIDGIVDDILVDTGTTLQAELDGIQADTEDIQSRLPAARVSGRIDASVGAMAANVMTAAAAAADLTTELQSGLAIASLLYAVDTEIDTIDTNVDAILVDTGTDIPAAFDALPTAAEINAEVVDALATDTYAEPGQGAPGATISLASKVGYLYKAWRNKSEQTATEYTLYNDNETTPGQQATVSDDSTTFTRGEMGTGA